MSSFAAVDELTESGDEGGENLGKSTPRLSVPQASSRRKSSKRKREEASACFKKQLSSEDSLRNLLAKACVQCNHRCLEKFKSLSKFKELKEFRDDWVGLDKLDQDQLAFDRIRGILEEPRDEGVPPRWTFLNVQVCLRAWKRLHALGHSLNYYA